MKLVASTLAVLAASVLALGCSGASAEEDTDEGAAVIAPRVESALLDLKKAVKGTVTIPGALGSVTVDGTTAVVTTPEAPQVGDAITRAFPQSAEAVVEIARVASGKVESSVTKFHNGDGLLSLTLSVQGEADLRATLTNFNFDLQTGAELRIADVLTPEGLKSVVSQCKAKGGIESLCDGTLSFQIKERVMSVFLTGATAEQFSFRAEGVAIPWKSLRGNIKHASVNALANKAADATADDLE